MAFWFPCFQLLGVHPSILLEALTHRKIEAKTEEVKMTLDGNVPALPAPTIAPSLAFHASPLAMPFPHEVFAHAVPSTGTLFPVLL